jgi:CHAT domain-containing protein/tetratricopeptide (TPR) repeat protein
MLSMPIERGLTRRAGIALVLCFALVAGASTPGRAQTVPFVAPPRTIADITAILDQQKPDPQLAAKLHADADRMLPAGLGALALAHFYYDRGQARGQLGRYADAIADGEKALMTAKGGHLDAQEIGRILQFLMLQNAFFGDPRKSLELALTMARETNQPGAQGLMFNAYRWAVMNLVRMGDLAQADQYLRRSQALLATARSWPTFAALHAGWEANVAQASAHIFEAKGRYKDAEDAYRRAEIGLREAMTAAAKRPLAPPPLALQFNIDSVISDQGRVKAEQGRLAEGEADIRRALLSQLKVGGKYTDGTDYQLRALAIVLVQQGRYPEAEKILRAELDILHSIGFSEDALQIVNSLFRLANLLNMQDRPQEAAQVYDQLDQATKGWDLKRRELLELSTARVYTQYLTGRLDAGIAAARTLVARNTARFGDKHFNTALAHGVLAIGLARAGRDADAMREFKDAIPALLSASLATDEDDSSVAAARNHELQVVVEQYMALLARAPADTGFDPAVESFRLADVIRGRSVQQALAASSARVAARDPGLADLVRKEQDLGKQVNALLGLLTSILASPPEQRDDKAVRDLGAETEKLRAARAAARAEIGRRFPSYADLIDPKPPTVDAIKSMLKGDEALVSFYFGSQASFVWAVPKTGTVTFGAIPASAEDIDAKVRKLRAALEPDATTIDAIPPFDVALAHELYGLLLGPVEAGWKGAKNLVVVTNGALGELPLSLLPTAPAQVEAASELPFAGYRNVPWLARTHAVTMIPSASALITLRRLPPGSPKRDKLIGFGDPYFSEQEAIEAERAPIEPVQVALAPAGDVGATVTRGIPLRLRAAPRTEQVDSAELGLLPRLPDTRAELIAVARALEVDPQKVLYLGKEANELNVQTINLARFQIVAFSTHGLVPGDLNGLTQPALALTAPEVAGVKGDGLLTMEKVLALKLDADWVVLSACNTAAGAGAGAEAVSGLGRAFFYAGTRALLVTNWSVHSASARELISDLFRRQSAAQNVTRAEALRQAMMALLDGPGFTDGSGKTQFTYAHPLFWAPYSVIGDGG